MAVKDKKKEKKATTPGKWFQWLSVTLIFIASISLYHKSLKNDFLDLDDMSIIVRNYSFLNNISNAGQVFKQGAFQVQGEKDTLTSYYRPIMILSFMADTYISPAKSTYPIPEPYIRGNIFYHTLACIFLLFLLLELKIAPLPSLFLSLIFTVHPILNQAVAWIPGRNDSLLTLFILISFICLLKYLKTNKIGVLVLHILFFLLALFTKENALMFMPLSLLFLYFNNRKTQEIKFQKPLLKTYILIGSVYLLCLVPWLIFRHIALSTNADSSNIIDLIKTITHNFPYIIQYISKSVLPFNLSVMSTAADTNYLLGILALVILLAGIVLSKKKNTSLVLFGFCWFFLFLSPSFFSAFSGLEHRAYLPLIGLIITTSQFDIIKTASFKGNGISARIGAITLAGIFLLFYYLTLNRLPIFENRFAFDESGMETSPHSILPCIYLAVHYEQEKEYEKAIAAYREALKRDSTSELALGNMAGDYICLNMYHEAENELRTELRQHPSNYIAVFNLGLVIFQYEHNDSLGVALWKKSVSINPSFARPYKVLSQYYQARGDSSNTQLYRNLYINSTK
jgi:protein O-mannosyl-transferase